MSTAELEPATKATLSFTGRNPDVLTCIANLSNDEVFTPPDLANQMLDLVADAWAEANDGAIIWEDPSVTFLDPATKSGVFLREITKRLVDGLAEKIPDLQERVDHILTKQVFGIGITELTAMLARRSLYCSKHAQRTDENPHSIATGFDHDDGNVWFERTEHEWVKGRCQFCGAGESALGRGADLESHAYAFIHTNDIKARVAELFGDDMKFDVIIGNPPYQLESDGGTRDLPIYQKFVEQGRRLGPRFLSLVVPSRWMAGGLGLTEFRSSVLSDRQMRRIVDFPVAREVFPGVEIKGGVCYFLWEEGSDDLCDVSTVRGDDIVGPISRDLDEFDVFVRDSRALPILRKVLQFGEESLADVLSPRTAFGLLSNYSGYRTSPQAGDVKFYATSPTGRFTAWVSPSDATIRHEEIETWKALIPEAGSDGGQKIPDVVLGKPWVAERPSICTQSFIFVGTETKEAAQSVASYYSTRFVRFLVSLRKITQHAKADAYRWVPQQSWDRIWTDEELYKKYGITDDEVAFIESMIRPMELPDA